MLYPKRQTKREQQIKLQCEFCGKDFKRSVALHEANMARGRTKVFCSRECASASKRKKATAKTESQRIKAARDGFMEICPSCGERFLKVVETRKNNLGYRRRKKHCQHCNYRLTTIELPEDVAQTYLDKQALHCLQCNHNNKEANRCDFTIPEYMTPDAQDCNFFEQRS